jgi:RimJ/RimL family protein N-acetyltransferase
MEPNPYIISTERLGLRRWLERDRAPFIQMNKDPDVMKFFPGILSADQSVGMIEKINQHFDRYHFGLFAVESLATKTFMGYTGFSSPSFQSFFTPCTEIGWQYKKQFWGQGFATEAAAACMIPLPLS